MQDKSFLSDNAKLKRAIVKVALSLDHSWHGDESVGVTIA
jgi:hypothetical protein